MKTDYKVGDDCWIYMGRHNGKMTKGKILMKLDLSEFNYCVPGHFLIEIKTHIDPILEVRDPFSMSPAENEPIGLWAMARDRYKKSGAKL